MAENEIVVVKDEENELPIPSVWRPVFIEIVNAFVRRDYFISDGVDNVSPVSNQTAVQVKEYIEDYGEELVQLPEETWESSIYIWMGTYWGVLVDLFTAGEGRSDLVLRAEVTESDTGYVVDIIMVYVP